jgi:hypothetical protein
VCLALGFYKGAFHVEAIYTETGPMLIECNPRVGGGPVVEYNKACTWRGIFKGAKLILHLESLPPGAGPA